MHFYRGNNVECEEASGPLKFHSLPLAQPPFSPPTLSSLLLDINSGKAITLSVHKCCGTIILFVDSKHHLSWGTQVPFSDKSLNGLERALVNGEMAGARDSRPDETIFTFYFFVSANNRKKSNCPW